MASFDEWLKHSSKWRSTLDAKIAAFEGGDMLVNFESVAFAFPSKEPHPYSFDIPSIDEAALSLWAEEHNLLATTAPEKGISERRGFPPIRFTRK